MDRIEIIASQLGVTGVIGTIAFFIESFKKLIEKDALKDLAKNTNTI